MDTEGGQLTEVWRGGVNTWECDEMGHMNSRFYVSRCIEAVGVLFAKFGQQVAASDALKSYPKVEEMHIRFHREALVASPLHMCAGFMDVNDDEADIVLLLYHSLTDTLAASFNVTVRADGGEKRWSQTFKDAVRLRLVTQPEEAKPRSLKNKAGPFSGPIWKAEGFTSIALGMVQQESCDQRGMMVAHKFIGAVADGARQLTNSLREVVVAHAEEPPQRYGGAVLEFRITHFDWPRAGECFEVKSAFTRADHRTLILEHWMFDPISGRPWGFMESVAVVLDLDRRKIVGISDKARERLEPLLVAN